MLSSFVFSLSDLSYAFLIRDSAVALPSIRTEIENITVFAQKIGGQYVKITITNALDENGLDFSEVQKAEGEIELVYSAHHEYDSTKAKALYSIENIDEISYELEEA